MLTYHQALALRLCLESPQRSVAYQRTFLHGHGLASNSISHTTAFSLAKKKLGTVQPGALPDQGVFVLAKLGEIAYREHKEKLNMENVEANSSEKKSGGKKAHKQQAAQIAKLSAPSTKEYVELYPEDVEITVDPEHPLFDRRAFEPLDMSICNNIEEHGQLEPPKVRVKPGGEPGYEIVDGRTRLRSARLINDKREKAGLPKLKYTYEVVKCDTPAMAAYLKHVYNEARNERDKLGKCEGMVELLRFGYSRGEVASLFHVTTKTVDRAKRVVSASEEVREALKEDKITLVRAIELAGLPAEQQPEALAEYLKAKEALEEAADTTEDKGGDEPKEAPVKKKQRKSLPWKKFESIVKGLKSHKLDDTKLKHTDADVGNAVRAAMEFVGGGGDKAKKKFEEAMEAIGFPLTPEETE